MLPGQLRRMAKLGDFRGVYLPFWTFDALTQAAYRCEVGYDETERYYSNGEWQTRTVTKWRWKNGNVSVPFDDLLVSGTTHITQGILDTISPFNMNELAPYEATYLAGWAAQAYEVLLEKAWDVGREEMRLKTRRSAETNALAGGGDRIRNMNIRIEFSNESWRYILLPVYLAAFQYDGETYQVVINGQSDAIGGRRPVSWPKVIVAILALFLPVPFFGLLALFIPPVGCLAALSLVIAIAVGLNILGKARKISNPDNQTPELLQGVQLW
jgi:hypothetical protein